MKLSLTLGLAKSNLDKRDIEVIFHHLNEQNRTFVEILSMMEWFTLTETVSKEMVHSVSSGRNDNWRRLL